MPRSSLSPRPALVLAAGFLALFVGGGARFAIGLTLKPIVADLGWTRSDIGLAVAVNLVVAAVAMFAAGYLVDRAGPRLVLVGGLFVSGIGIGAMAAMNAPWHAVALFGVVFALGNGAASMIPVGVMVTRAYPHRPGFANAAAMAGMSAGQLVMIAALAALMLSMGWRPIYALLGVAHIVLIPLLLLVLPQMPPQAARAARPQQGIGVKEALRGRRLWLLLAVYAICGFDDFFVTTHVVAFAQDRGAGFLLAGNLLALMGLTGLVGVIAGGMLSDRAGPMVPTAISFAARVAVFGLIAVDQSTVSVAIFALVFGATFLVTAPLTVVFVAQSFGSRHLGALTGLITMVHQICGGLGAYIGAALFDATGSYDSAFAIVLVISAIALVLSLMLRGPRSAAA